MESKDSGFATLDIENDKPVPGSYRELLINNEAYVLDTVNSLEYLTSVTNEDGLSVVFYRDTPLTGESREYINYRLRQVDHYLEGKRHGHCQQYNDNGKIFRDETYYYGRLIAKKVFYSSGELLSEMPLADQNGLAVSKDYYKNGALNWESTLLNGHSHGLSRQYYPSGQVFAEYYYQFGQIEGLVKHYHENGMLKSEISYQHGKMHGTIKEYDAKGVLIKETVYNNGEEVVEP